MRNNESADITQRSLSFIRYAVSSINADENCPKTMQKYNIWKQLLGAVSVLLSLQIHAQNPVAEGANSLGLTDTTVWAGNSNPANLSQLNSTIVGFGARNSYILPELSRYYAAAAMRAGSSVVAADLQYFGFSVWQETSAGVSVSRKLMQTVSLSAKLTYQYIGHGI